MQRKLAWREEREGVGTKKLGGEMGSRAEPGVMAQ